MNKKNKNFKEYFFYILLSVVCMRFTLNGEIVYVSTGRQMNPTEQILFFGKIGKGKIGK